MGCRRNELRNAAGLISKLRIIVAVQVLKTSFYKQLLVPPHFVYSGDRTEGSEVTFRPSSKTATGLPHTEEALNRFVFSSRKYQFLSSLV